MNTSKNKIKSLMLVLFLSVTAISTASARVCFLPDSTDCGSSDVNIPDVPCKYYNCKEAGLKNETYQTCYDERTYNNGGVNVNCKQVKCNISKSDCEAQAKATSQSCKFDDASGCYYLGECKQCNKDLYDLKEPKSGSDWECDSCTGCDGTFYSCTAIEKECQDINSKYTSSCSDSQTAEEVKGVKDSHGNQCYTCKDKPIDKCVDIEATPFLDIIEPTVTTVKASGEVKEVNAKLECGINPKKAYKYEAKITSDYDYINLPIQRIKPVEYRYYVSGSLPGYYYKTNIDGKNVCITDRLCTQYAKEGKYISAYEISIQDMSVRLDHKIYCCKTDDNFSGDSLSHLYSSCKEAQTVFESQHIDRYIEPFYVCDKGIKEGTKCKIGSYSCPKDYKLSGDNCVKKECPKGYVLTSDNGKDVCVNPTYTCPTDGKYKYKLSGNKCVCDNDCTYEYVHLTKNDTGTDNYDRQRLRYGIDGEICTTEGSTREQTSSCIYSCSNGSCKCGSKYGPVCSPAGSSCKIKQKCAIYRDCEYGTKCFNVIQNNPSITNGRLSGTPEWGTIYNKISNNSASCVANGVRKYETLCEGTIKEKCQGSQTFVPNGCVSDIYSDGGVYVAGAIWGNCVCPTDKEFYDTAEECKKMTGKNCTYYNFCYQTCESRGSFSTQEACLTGKNTRQQCIEKYGCYVRKAVGFTITQNSPNACGGWSFYLMDADGNYVNGDGIHEAGNYSVVITGSGRLISHANVSSRQSGGGWCFGDQAENKGCEKTKLTGIHRSESKAHSFQDGMDYTISVSCL